MSSFTPRTNQKINASKQLSKIEPEELAYAGGSDEEEEDEGEDEEENEEEENEEEEADEEDDEEQAGGDKDGNDDSDDEEIIKDVIAPAINPLAPVLDSDDDDEDEVDESYLQKFNAIVNKNYIMDFHPECVISNYDEVVGLTKIVRDTENNIIDDLHKTLPYLTKYERARVLGQRAKQINAGAKVFVKVPENVIDGYLIAEQELAQKRIPFIIRRPTPGGGCEYWNLRDLELIQF